MASNCFSVAVVCVYGGLYRCCCRQGRQGLERSSKRTEQIEKKVMELEKKQAFWSGVVRGVIGSAVFFAGLVTVIYYIVGIVVTVK